MAQGRTLWELVESRAGESPDGLLAVDETGRQISFGRFLVAAEEMAAGLQARGVAEGARVSWQLPTWIETMVLTGALARLGAVQNPIIPGYGERELRFVVQQAGAGLLIVPGRWRNTDYGAMARTLAEEGGLDALVVDPAERDFPRGDRASLGPPPVPASDGGPVRWLYYTSGTTAEPKGVQHTDATVIAAVPGMLQMLRPGPGDRASVVFPYAHIGGLVWLATALTSGACQILTEQFRPETTIPMLAERGVTLAGTGTPFNLAYLSAQRALEADAPGSRLFPEVRAFMSGASPKPDRLHYELKAEFGGAGIMSSYGLTECPILSASSSTDPDDRLARTEGRASPGVEIRIVTAGGRTGAPGEEGEVRVRGGQLFKGYVDGALDAGALDDDGFLRTGDLGTLDRDGYLTITGRLKDVIIRKGENISAKEVEDLLYQHPKVADVAVVGLPDAASGERACAVIASAPGATGLTMEEMQAFLKDKGLRTYAMPEQIEFVPELPRNAAGKVQKAELKQRYST